MHAVTNVIILYRAETGTKVISLTWKQNSIPHVSMTSLIYGTQKFEVLFPYLAYSMCIVYPFAMWHLVFWIYADNFHRLVNVAGSDQLTVLGFQLKTKLQLSAIMIHAISNCFDIMVYNHYEYVHKTKNAANDRSFKMRQNTQLCCFATTKSRENISEE